MIDFLLIILQVQIKGIATVAIFTTFTLMIVFQNVVDVIRIMTKILVLYIGFITLLGSL